MISTREAAIYKFMDIERKTYNTTLRIDLIRELKILSAEKDKRQNDLLEEAIQDLLQKYGKSLPEKK